MQGVAKAAAANTNLFDYFSRPWDLHLPGVQLRVVVRVCMRRRHVCAASSVAGRTRLAHLVFSTIRLAAAPVDSRAQYSHAGKGV